MLAARSVEQRVSFRDLGHSLTQADNVAAISKCRTASEFVWVAQPAARPAATSNPLRFAKATRLEIASANKGSGMRRQVLTPGAYGTQFL